MTVTETQIQTPEHSETRPFNAHDYCIGVYEAARELPILAKFQEEGRVVTKERCAAVGGGDVFREIENFDDTIEEAGVMASWGLEQFIRDHPGMGDKQRAEFARVVNGFSIFSNRLAKADDGITKMSGLSPDEFGETIKILSGMYLQSVQSQERRAAEDALGQYARYLVEQETAGDQHGKIPKIKHKVAA